MVGSDPVAVHGVGGEEDRGGIGTVLDGLHVRGAVGGGRPDQSARGQKKQSPGPSRSEHRTGGDGRSGRHDAEAEV